jgi:hypothetical protein
MTIFVCDHCGKQSPGENYAPDWEKVIVSTSFHYDICPECAPALFQFVAKGRLLIKQLEGVAK